DDTADPRDQPAAEEPQVAPQNLLQERHGIKPRGLGHPAPLIGTVAAGCGGIGLAVRIRTVWTRGFFRRPDCPQRDQQTLTSNGLRRGREQPAEAVKVAVGLLQY